MSLQNTAHVHRHTKQLSFPVVKKNSLFSWSKTKSKAKELPFETQQTNFINSLQELHLRTSTGKLEANDALNFFKLDLAEINHIRDLIKCKQAEYEALYRLLQARYYRWPFSWLFKARNKAVEVKQTELRSQWINELQILFSHNSLFISHVDNIAKWTCIEDIVKKNKTYLALNELQVNLQQSASNTYQLTKSNWLTQSCLSRPHFANKLPVKEAEWVSQVNKNVNFLNQYAHYYPSSKEKIGKTLYLNKALQTLLTGNNNWNTIETLAKPYPHYLVSRMQKRNTTLSDNNRKIKDSTTEHLKTYIETLTNVAYKFVGVYGPHSQKLADFIINRIYLNSSNKGYAVSQQANLVEAELKPINYKAQYDTEAAEIKNQLEQAIAVKQGFETDIKVVFQAAIKKIGLRLHNPIAGADKKLNEQHANTLCQILEDSLPKTSLLPADLISAFGYFPKTYKPVVTKLLDMVRNNYKPSSLTLFYRDDSPKKAHCDYNLEKAYDYYAVLHLLKNNKGIYYLHQLLSAKKNIHQSSFEISGELKENIQEAWETPLGKQFILHIKNKLHSRLDNEAYNISLQELLDFLTNPSLEIDLPREEQDYATVCDC